MRNKKIRFTFKNIYIVHVPICRMIELVIIWSLVRSSAKCKSVNVSLFAKTCAFQNGAPLKCTKLPCQWIIKKNQSKISDDHQIVSCLSGFADPFTLIHHHNGYSISEIAQTNNQSQLLNSLGRFDCIQILIINIVFFFFHFVYSCYIVVKQNSTHNEESFSWVSLSTPK